MFPEKRVYNTADATLWFFHALDRYIEATGGETLKILPKLLDIVDHHERYGSGSGSIRMTPAAQGTRFYRLPDGCHVGDWVVTPRRVKLRIVPLVQRPSAAGAMG